jgi:hypothetical protein
MAILAITLAQYLRISQNCKRNRDKLTLWLDSSRCVHETEQIGAIAKRQSGRFGWLEAGGANQKREPIEQLALDLSAW